MKCSLNIDMTTGGYYAYSTQVTQCESVKEAEEFFRNECLTEHIADGTKWVGYLFKGHVYPDCTDLDPDWMLTLGPKGGVRKERL